MPLPHGFIQVVFAADDTYPAGPDPWAGSPSKIPLTGYSLGIVPGETVPADALNFELGLASKLRYLTAIEAINWSHGEDPVRAGLDDCMIVCPVFLPAEGLWIAGGLAAGTKHLLVSVNGRYWSDQTPGGFPGVLGVATCGDRDAGVMQPHDTAVVFVASGDLYTRRPDSYSGDIEGPVAPATVSAWADASSATGADNTQAYMADPEEEYVVWAGCRFGDVARLARIHAAPGGTTSVAVVSDAELDVAAYEYQVTEYVSLLAHPITRRVVCFVLTIPASVQQNIFRYCDNDPNFLTDWQSPGASTIISVATHGKVCGLGVDYTTGQYICVTTTGRCYRSPDLVTWTRFDSDTGFGARTFRSLSQIGAITYARGTWNNPANTITSDGIWHSLDYGQTWRFDPAPLETTFSDLNVGKRLRPHGDRLTYHAYDTTAEVSEIAHSLLTGSV